jgi:hypothetical protein
MPRTTNRLSTRTIKAIKGPAVLFDGDGLLLRVSAAGAKSWVFRYQSNGTRRDMGLGAVPSHLFSQSARVGPRVSSTAPHRDRSDRDAQ